METRIGGFTTMKKLLIAATILLFASSAFAAEEFVPVTKDSEVTSIDQVQVKKVVTEQKVKETVYTSASINEDIAKLQNEITKKQARIAHLQGDIDSLQADIDKLKALQTTVLKEAEKIELKVVEEPKPIEEVK
jgi:TolA-binding protein